VFLKRYSRVSSVLASWLLLAVIGCAHMRATIIYYDPTTYKNLMELKSKIIALYDTFTGDLVDNAQISAIRVKLTKMYKYKKGKGEKNKETYTQIGKIQEIFERHVNDRLQGGKWNLTHANNQKETIAEAFDIAIETEVLKKKK